MHNLICDFCSSDQRFAHGLVCSPHPASFRSRFTADTLAFGYILPTTGRIRDLHPLETCAVRRTKKLMYAKAYMSLILYDLPGLYGYRLTRIVDKSRCARITPSRNLFPIYRKNPVLSTQKFFFSTVQPEKASLQMARTKLLPNPQSGYAPAATPLL